MIALLPNAYVILGPHIQVLPGALESLRLTLGTTLTKFLELSYWIPATNHHLFSEVIWKLCERVPFSY